MRASINPAECPAVSGCHTSTSPPDTRIFGWGIFGGVPYYLDGVDLGQDLGAVLIEEVLSQKRYLHKEVDVEALDRQTDQYPE